MKIAIIGAGISGLAVGRFLDSYGHEVDIFEAAKSDAAGLLESRNVGGYEFDVGGGHIIYTRDQWLQSFIKELFVNGTLLEHERRTKILYNDRFVKYPFENGLSDLPHEANFECVFGFIQAYINRRKTGEPDNFHDWIYYRMGPGMAKHFMVPYNEKIWNIDLSELGVAWVSGRVPETPLQDIVRSSLGISTEGYKHQMKFAYPLKGGINDVAKKVGMPVEDRIFYNHAVEHIEKKGDHRFDVDGAEYEEVVYTAPLDRAPQIVSGLDRKAGEAAASLGHISLTTFLFGLDEEDARPFSWVYLPFPEQGPANRLTYLSNYSPSNAPDGKASILVEVTHRGPLRMDAGYVRELRMCLQKSGFLREGAKDVEAHGSKEYAYILFDREFERKRSTAVKGMEELGIRLLGRFGRYDYYNMDHCIIEAKRLAEKIHDSGKET